MTQIPEENEVNKGGRPPVTWEEFVSVHPNWEEIVKKNYSEGRSDERIRRDLAMYGAQMLCHGLFTRFIDTVPQFSKAIKEGREVSKLWWLEVGQDNLWEAKFSPTLWFMNMKNRHNWRDKQPDEVSKVYQVTTGSVSISTPEENLKLIQAAKAAKEEKK